MSLLRRLFGKRPPAPPVMPEAVFDAPAPDVPFVAIGDIHGCADLLSAMLDKIDAAYGTSVKTVFVGDYIDRGEDSAGVLKIVTDRAAAQPDNCVCLIGNHEEMALNFLDNPAEHGQRWLRYGGLQTLASFGIGGVSETSSPNTLEAAAESFAIALGPDMVSWLRGLQVMWASGNVTVVHAGADPALPINLQAKSALIWGHPDFAKVPRSDGNWVVHGHTIVDAPQAEQGRISIDTGAYATRKLTGVVIDGQQPLEFISV